MTTVANADRSKPLKVAVAGGGPAGLTFALNLSMLLGAKAEITVYEGRWTEDNDGNIRWKNKEDGNIRRDQVVSLQDHVINQLPEYIREGIFQNIRERVWSLTHSIPITEVEDRLLYLTKPFVDEGWIKLIPENLDKDNEAEFEQNDFHLLIGADGAGLFIRKYCSIQMIDEGTEYNCGVAFSIPDTVLDDEKPLHQAMNCILSSVQTRYLVNASGSRRGFLNVRLKKEEYDELNRRLNDLKNKKSELDLGSTYHFPYTPIWSTIRQGLAFFNIVQRYVTRITPIEIKIRHSSVVVRELQCKMNCKYEPGTQKIKKRLAFLIGDAAMNVHFWLGRGMNSGMKEAMALARNICSALESHDWDPNALQYTDFLEYVGFMARLRAREQGGRSLRVLNDPIDNVIDQADKHRYSFDSNSCKFIELLKTKCKSLTSSEGWPHHYNVTDEELVKAVGRLGYMALAEVSGAVPWPTEDWSGKEVLVEHTYPINPSKYLPVPKPSNRSVSYSRSYSRSQSSTKRSSGPPMILWFLTGTEQQIDNNPELKSDSIHFVTLLMKQKFGRDPKETTELIRLVRSKFPRAPVLVYSNGQHKSRPDREFHHVSITDDLNNIYAFVKNTNVSELQWSDGISLNGDLSDKRLSSMSQSSSSSSLSLPSPSETNKIIVWIVDDSRAGSKDAILQQVKEKSESVPHIEFVRTYSDFERYFQQHYKKIGKIISRGHYANEHKDCVDVLKLCYSKRQSSFELLLTTSATDQQLKEYFGRRHKDLDDYWDRLNVSQRQSDAVDFILKPQSNS